MFICICASIVNFEIPIFVYSYERSDFFFFPILILVVMIFLQSVFMMCDMYFRLVLSHYSISYSFSKCESLLIILSWRSCQQVCMVSHLWEIRECRCAKRLFPLRGLIYHHCSASRTKIDTCKT